MAQIERLPERAREVVEYRKSGLSLNHVQGCPLGCAYCIRHTYGLWDQDRPCALMSDADAVEELVSHSTERLIQAGFHVLRVDCSQQAAQHAAAHILDRITTSVAPPKE
ncbi:MAG: hypothetical protein ACRDS9_13085 [Pseudonocardiaceae bacterium]